MGSVNTQATRSTLTSVDTTLSENITATQDYIPVASTTNFSTSVVAEIESTNEVVSFTDLSENLLVYSEDFTSGVTELGSITVTADTTTAPDGTTTADTATFTNNFHYMRKTFTAAANTQYTFSFYVKRGTATNLKYSVFDLTRSTDIVSATSYYSQTSSSDWNRISVTFTTHTTPGSYNIGVYPFRDSDATGTAFIWGAMVNEGSTADTYLPTTTTSLKGLTGVTRGVNGTTAQAASSGDSIQQLPYALGSVDMPVRLRAISVSPDGTGAARLTLCDNNGDTLCDVDIPDGKSYTLNLPEDGIIFPNGVFVSNTVKITAYTVYTEKYSGPYLTS